MQALSLVGLFSTADALVAFFHTYNTLTNKAEHWEQLKRTHQSHRLSECTAAKEYDQQRYGAGFMMEQEHKQMSHTKGWPTRAEVDPTKGRPTSATKESWNMHKIGLFSAGHSLASSIL